MNNWVDYHIHTTFSDGKNVYLDYLKKAKEIGATEIGFSDHITLHSVDWRTDPKNYSKLKEELSAICNNKASEISVKFGLEVDYFPYEEKEIAALINQFPVDYVIGSVHFIDDWNFDSDKSLYGKIENDLLYQKYFKLIQKAAQSKLFDIIGHFDLIKKFQCYPTSNQDALIKETLKVIKENNIAIELNTSGLDKPCKEFYPSKEILQEASKQKIPITLGSDSHQTKHLNRYFSEGVTLLKQLGFQKIAKFEKRKRTFISI